ncbi:unnamed protein product [Clavelina lepadiformis]|uniref:Pre-mRNA-splicing regulator WTAP n=2 Tax=Clavelina lepadiformis TaxID=159417 RepID=A0ABP0F1B6_CLALP
MGEHSPPPSKRTRFSQNELADLSKDELVVSFRKQQEYIEQLEAKVSCQGDEDTEEKDKNHVSESSRRENILVMRLANKEQEVHEYVAQISHIRKAQEDAAIISLRQANLDPGVNLIFGKMREELQQTKDKLEQAQSELSAWKFTPDSQNGKKLISRCRTLIAENQDLGRQLSQGKTAKLEAELALQKKYSEELKTSQDELNEFVIQLDEEVEGMESTIQVLQQQLAATKRECEDYKQLTVRYERMLYDQKGHDKIEPHLKREADYDMHETASPSRSDSEEDYDIKDDENRRDHGSSYSLQHQEGYASNDDVIDLQPNEYSDITENLVSSPGTPVADSLQPEYVTDRSPGTPTEEKLDYMDDDTGSWNKDQTSCDAWDDRTNLDYTESGSEEAVEVEEEQQEVVSIHSDSEEDSDNIKAHISVVNPVHNNHRNDTTEDDGDLDGEILAYTSKKSCNTKTAAIVISPTSDSSKELNQNVFNLINEQVTANQTSPLDGMQAPKAQVLSDYCNNAPAESLSMPDEKPHRPGTMPSTKQSAVSIDWNGGNVQHTCSSRQELDSKSNATLTTQVMLQTPATSEPASKSCAGDILNNNHSLGVNSQNGIEENALIEKLE